MEGISQQWTRPMLAVFLLFPAAAHAEIRFNRDIRPIMADTCLSQASAAGFDIWVRDLEPDTLSRLSFIPVTNQPPVWTPDGRSIIFRSGGHAARGLYWMRPDGSGSPRRLTDGSADEVPYSFSPD